MSFTVSKNGRLALLNVATQVSGLAFLGWGGVGSDYVELSESALVNILSVCRVSTCGTYMTGCW